MESNEQNKLTSTTVRGIEAWSRPTAVRVEGGGGDRLKEGEGSSQRTCVRDSWTQTTMWGPPKGGQGLPKG